MVTYPSRATPSFSGELLFPKNIPFEGSPCWGHNFSLHGPISSNRVALDSWALVDAESKKNFDRPTEWKVRSILRNIHFADIRPPGVSLTILFLFSFFPFLLSSLFFVHKTGNSDADVIFGTAVLSKLQRRAGVHYLFFFSLSFLADESDSDKACRIETMHWHALE